MAGRLLSQKSETCMPIYCGENKMLIECSLCSNSERSESAAIHCYWHCLLLILLVIFWWNFRFDLDRCGAVFFHANLFGGFF